MKDAMETVRERPLFRKVLPYVALVVLLGLTLMVWWFWRGINDRKEAKRYDKHVQETVYEIVDRLHDCKMVVQGGGGVFAASETVSREEWRAYCQYQRADSVFPGIHGVGFTEIIESGDLEAHIRRTRAEGFPEYTVRPEGRRDLYTPLLYIEPLNARSRRAMGYDMFSNPLRRAFMEQARDTGEITLSGRVILDQEKGRNPQDGFLLYLPIYARGMPLDTVEARRAAIRGYVLGVFRIAHFIQGVFPEESPYLDFAIYDGDRVSQDTLMYTTDPPGRSPQEKDRPLFSSRKTLDLYGHRWTLAFESRPALEASLDRYTGKGILAAGALISFLAFLSLWMLERTSRRVFSLARHMTEALRESEARYRLLTENSGDAIWTIDLSGRLTYISPAIENLNGYTPEEVMAMPMTGYMVEEDCERLMARLAEELAKPPAERARSQTIEVQYRAKDGRTVDVEFNAWWLLDGQGNLMGIQGSTRDITERKQAEKDHIVRQAAEEASRQKSLFVSNMSHEIRTPLNAILGFAQILARDPSLTSRQAAQVRTISRSGRHLLLLINDILDIARIEAGRVALSPAVFSLQGLLADLEMMFRSRAEAGGLELIVERDESLPAHILGDEGKLRQVLVNLMGNAVKFTETGGVAVQVRSEPEEDGTSLRLVCEVDDSGPGISEEDLDHIFEAFSQAEAGSRAGGTGLGLAISRRFVEMMGGRLTVESTVGKGSCFRFEVRVARAEGAAVTEEPEPRQVTGLDPGTGPFRILVVDDVKDNRALVCALLDPVGFEVREAENGEEALAAFEEWSPHAVVMDMRMPVMDGYEATRRIKAMEAGRNTPVIAVTASAFKDSEEEVLATGVSAYLRKPFLPEELYEALGECLDLHYVYAEEPARDAQRAERPALTPESLSALPKDRVEAMGRAVEQGDMARLRELIGGMETLDAAAAAGLRALAEAYDYEKLGEVLGMKSDQGEDGK